MANGKDATRTSIGVSEGAGDVTLRKHAEETLLKAGALQRVIFNSANFSSIVTDARGVIQIFNVGAEHMLGYAAAEVMNKVTSADISDPQDRPRQGIEPRICNHDHDVYMPRYSSKITGNIVRQQT